MRRSTHPTSKLNAIICATLFAVAVSASAKGEQRSCQTTFGGQVVCGDLVLGITLEQYEAGLKKRAEKIRAEEAEKRTQLQKLVELTERATSAEKDSLRGQIAAVEAEKRALEAESKGVADRLTNLQSSYEEVVQKLAKADGLLKRVQRVTEAKDALDKVAGTAQIVAVWDRFGGKDAFFLQIVAMLSRGDTVGAESKLGEIYDELGKLEEQQRLELRRLVLKAAEIAEERANLAVRRGKYDQAESFFQQAVEIFQTELGLDHPKTLTVRENYDRLQELKKQNSGNPAR
jgi:tetratricopeptide (TPR) repeat protein